ncbi:MAG: AAA family ATPase, partial [Candidatus Pacebacteria bacterium]|nr:AAA family ATPase [Candidatus Paceibacterota bacterium]
GFYYVQTTDNELFSGNDWYSEERVQFGLDEFVISEANIKYVLRPSVILPNTFFQQYINEIYALFGVHGKEAMNGIIGYLGRWKKTTRENFYTTSWDTALSELRNPNVTVEPIYRKSTEARYTDLKDLVAAIDERDDLQHELAREDLIAIELQYTNTADFESNYLPIHKTIYDLSAIAMDKRRKRMGGKLLYQNCDRLVVEDGVAIEYGTDFGDARVVQVDGLRGEYHPSKLLKPDAFCTRDIYTLESPTWTYIPSAPFEQHADVNIDPVIEQLLSDSVYLWGEGGTGKSSLIKRLQAWLTRQGIPYLSAAPTANAAQLIDGMTVHKLLGLGYNDAGLAKTAITGETRFVFIDEVSMLSVFMINELLKVKTQYPDLKFVMSGDLGCQLPPVKDRFYPDDMTKQFAWMYLCSFRQLQLTKNWRLESDPDAATLIKDLRAIRAGTDMKAFLRDMKKRYGSTAHPIAITHTKVVMDHINETWNGYYCDELQKMGAPLKAFHSAGAYQLYAGVEVICLKNSRFRVNDEFVFVVNGARLKIKKIRDGVVTFVSGIEVPLAQFPSMFDLCYGITCHRAQGQTFTEPFTIYEADESRAQGPEFRQWLYTAVSRASRASQINFVSCSEATGIMKYWIYRLTQKQTGRAYVGSTRRYYKNRIVEHFLEENKSAVLEDVQRFGADSFSVDVLEHDVVNTWEQIREREQYFIDKYDTVARGYNRLNAHAE